MTNNKKRGRPELPDSEKLVPRFSLALNDEEYARFEKAVDIMNRSACLKSGVNASIPKSQFARTGLNTYVNAILSKANQS